MLYVSEMVDKRGGEWMNQWPVLLLTLKDVEGAVFEHSTEDNQWSILYLTGCRCTGE